MFLKNTIQKVFSKLGFYSKPINIAIIGQPNSGKTSFWFMLQNGRLYKASSKSRLQNLERDSKDSKSKDEHYENDDLNQFEEIRISDNIIHLYDLGDISYYAKKALGSETASEGEESGDSFNPAAYKNLEETLKKIDGFVYVLDGANTTSVITAKEELKWMSENKLFQKPMVIISNKIDKSHSFSEYQLREALDIYLFQAAQKDSKSTFQKLMANERSYSNSIQLFMCSVVKRVGLIDSINWLLNAIQNP